MLKDRESSEGSPAVPDECGGCGGRIQDRYYLLAVDRQWHGSCLRCCECRIPLDTELTCFSRDGNIYCKDDYYRLFCAKRCARCGNGIAANEMVMRAKEMVFHLTCFTCVACGTVLSKGDIFGMRESLVYCRPHYDSWYLDDYEDIGSVYSEGDSPSQMFTNQGQKGRPRKRKTQGLPDDVQVQTMRMASTALEILHHGDLSSSMESLAYDTSVTSPGSVGSHQRTKRMRTSFKHHQLRTMKSYFAINQNPDAKDLKQLAQKTGLSKRVLQVWFQNARAKWRRNIMRQDSGSLGSLTPNGQSHGNGSIINHAHSGPNGMLLSEPHQSIEDMRVTSLSSQIVFNEIY